MALANFDPTRHYSGNNPESAAAFQSIKGIRISQMDLVHRFIRANPCTCEDVENALRIKHQAASARITELVAAGMIYDTGRRAKTTSGCSARVYADCPGVRQMRLL